MKNVYIPKPCSENWELMSPQDKGRFCDLCNKCVVDFTEKNPQEVEQILEENKDTRICGRFYNHQLGDHINQSQKLKVHFLKYIPSSFQNNGIVLSLFSVILFLIGCSKPKVETYATTGFVDVIEEDSCAANDKYAMGEARILDNDSIAKMPKNDPIKLKRKESKK
ncbi:hypothetical protein SAMN06265171_103359 [Chryseobacterium rhizoplanae]|uniref:Uncharacterized protein n=1 Tax=Chryseobacterium rhizoplanae TaxID=1609531 RepID=A0A521CU92_9FLAO|nr:hypothetical protein [Chryseobacterium rhizoplanae]SMO62230.1 hypothetical protein SAMN06265171_103359 [Chryseobacterium rhizoplanae]